MGQFGHLMISNSIYYTDIFMDWLRGILLDMFPERIWFAFLANIGVFLGM
jgi:hypothetical protein